MPEARTARIPVGCASAVDDVVLLLDRYAEADRDLADALDRIGSEGSASRRVSHSTVSYLLALLERSLVPGVRAKTELEALPASLRRAGVAAWARRAASRADRPIEGTA